MFQWKRRGSNGVVNSISADVNAPVETEGLILGLLPYQYSNIANVVNYV
jgi:hypothetical protein